MLPKVALATTGIGSLPRPTWLGERTRGSIKFALEGAALAEALDDATILALREQEEVGIDIVTDGEQRRSNFINHAIRNWSGVNLADQRRKGFHRNRPSDLLLPAVTGAVVHQSAGLAGEVRFAKAHTTRPVKMALPGPMTLVDSTVDDHYGDESAQALAMAEALNRELLELQAAGCDMIQIDEPAMTRYHDKVRSYGLKALDRALQGITIPTVVHLCYGYPDTGRGKQQYEYRYEVLLPMLMETRIGGFTVEFGRSDFDPAILKLCGDRIVMFGCIDPGDTPVPLRASVEKRIAEALEYVDPAKLMLSPDCGLMMAGRDGARAKLAVMVEAARDLRHRLA